MAYHFSVLESGKREPPLKLAFKTALAMTIGRRGYSVREVLHGVQLLIELRSIDAGLSDIDVVVSDIHLPLMTGLDAIATRRSPCSSTDTRTTGEPRSTTCRSANAAPRRSSTT